MREKEKGNIEKDRKNKEEDEGMKREGNVSDNSRGNNANGIMEGNKEKNA